MYNKIISRVTLMLLFLAGGAVQLHAQQAITNAGGNIGNSTGSLSYTVGEMAVQTSIARAITVVNITESFTEGVQQPYTDRDRQSNGIDPLTVSLAVYPNPTTDNVVLECSEAAQPLTFTLYGTNGQVLQHGIYSGGQQAIDMQNYGAGSYMLQVASPDKSKMNIYKIIKAK